ncbi:MAG: DUF2934 domain-containing protein [Rhodospirillaceae bacterium]
MTQTRDDRIRARAYDLWQADGGKLGDDWAYWLKAEQEITAQDAPAKKPAPKKAAAPAKKSNGQAAPKVAASKTGGAKPAAKIKKVTASAGPVAGKG